MPEATETETIVSEIQIDASPETVFAFFTEPDKLTRWLATEATLDPRPGGINLQTHAAKSGPYFMRGEFLEWSRRRGSCSRGATKTPRSRYGRAAARSR
jgi:uncharacterized protein YndB with AHSA1/START domain